MKVAWIFPCHERCGIAFYAEQYVAALSASIEVACFDIEDYFADPAGFLSKVNNYDVIHIQYEPSFFMRKGSDFYKKLCGALRPPVVVSLHEVYRSFPDVFPRDAICGHGPLAMVRRRLYDRRHPIQTSYYKHAGASFYARKVLVHQEFQAVVLREQNVPSDSIVTLPHPVMLLPGAVRSFRRDPSAPLHLAASGFINPHYNYGLLFASLRQLDMPWRFTWIGGTRRSEDEPLLKDIRRTIERSGWEDRFLITGWVTDEKLAEHFFPSDIICALFSARSSSGTLAAAFGALRPVIATPLPLTEELSSKYGILHLVSATPEGVKNGICKLVNDELLRTDIVNNVVRYREANSFDRMASRLIALYQSVLRS